MKHLTIIILCLFLISISVFAFADDPAQVKQPEQKMETDAEKDELIKVARELPSTLMTDEEQHSRIMKEIDELKEAYVYDEDPHE